MGALPEGYSGEQVREAMDRIHQEILLYASRSLRSRLDQEIADLERGTGGAGLMEVDHGFGGPREAQGRA